MKNMQQELLRDPIHDPSDIYDAIELEAESEKFFQICFTILKRLYAYTDKKKG